VWANHTEIRYHSPLESIFKRRASCPRGEAWAPPTTTPWQRASWLRSRLSFCTGAAGPGGPLRVFTLLHDGRPVLLNHGEPSDFDIAPWTPRVLTINAKYAGT
jgi:hypothetical protein